MTSAGCVWTRGDSIVIEQEDISRESLEIHWYDHLISFILPIFPSFPPLPPSLPLPPSFLPLLPSLLPPSLLPSFPPSLLPSLPPLSYLPPSLPPSPFLPPPSSLLLPPPFLSFPLPSFLPSLLYTLLLFFFYLVTSFCVTFDSSPLLHCSSQYLHPLVVIAGMLKLKRTEMLKRLAAQWRKIMWLRQRAI